MKEMLQIHSQTKEFTANISSAREKDRKIRKRQLRDKKWARLEESSH